MSVQGNREAEEAEAGAPPKYVQEQLGHSSIQITMDIYSHLFPGGGQEWINKLGKVLTASAEGAASPERTAPASPDAPRGSLLQSRRMRRYRVNPLILLRKGLVPPIRIERTTHGLGNRCSIQLSYGGKAKYQ